MTIRRYVCLCCDGKSGDGTLRRLRPHKIYVCQRCIALHCGLPAIEANLSVLMQQFNDRRQKELA